MNANYWMTHLTMIFLSTSFISPNTYSSYITPIFKHNSGRNPIEKTSSHTTVSLMVRHEKQNLPPGFICKNKSDGKWIKGWILPFPNKDTVFGYIRKDWKGNLGPREKEIYFKDGPENKIETYFPTNLSSFGIENKNVYQTIVVKDSKMPTPYKVPDSCAFNKRDTLIDVTPNNNSRDARDFRRFKKVDFNLPINHFMSPPNAIFAHVLLITSRMAVYEAFNERTRYYIIPDTTGLDATELYQFEAYYKGEKIDGDLFRSQLISLAKRLFTNEHDISNYKYKISNTLYMDTQIVSLLIDMNQKLGETVIYKY